MIQVIDIATETKRLSPIQNRGPHTTEVDVIAAFATLGQGDFPNTGVYLGSFDGDAGWERHVTGDELVQVIAGSAEFDIIVDGERHMHELTPGLLLIVPKGCWHRFRSPEGVTVLTATPRQDEAHTFIEDPRSMQTGN